MLESTWCLRFALTVESCWVFVMVSWFRTGNLNLASNSIQSWWCWWKKWCHPEAIHQSFETSWGPEILYPTDRTEPMSHRHVERCPLHNVMYWRYMIYRVPTWRDISPLSPYPPFPIVLEFHHFLIGFRLLPWAFCFGVRCHALRSPGIAWGRVWAICKRWSPQAHGCEVKRGTVSWNFATLGKVNQLINVIYAWKLGNDESKCDKCKLSCSNVVCRVLASEKLSQTPAFQWDLDCQSFVETWDDLYNCLRFLGWMIVI